MGLLLLDGPFHTVLLIPARPVKDEARDISLHSSSHSRTNTFLSQYLLAFHFILFYFAACMDTIFHLGIGSLEVVWRPFNKHLGRRRRRWRWQVMNLSSTDWFQSLTAVFEYVHTSESKTRVESSFILLPQRERGKRESAGDVTHSHCEREYSTAWTSFFFARAAQSKNTASR